MKPIIVFGDRDLAEMAKFYFGDRVIGFTKHFPEKDIFCNLPMYDFEKIESTFTNEEVEIFAPLTDNRTRANIYKQVKMMGYKMPTFIHPTAHVWNHKAVGDNCFIQELNNIQYRTSVGNNVVMWAGNHVGHHGTVRDHVFITSHVVVSGHCDIKNYCWLGVNSTIRDFTVLAEGTMLGASTNVTKSINEAYGVYIGNPAKRIGNVD